MNKINTFLADKYKETREKIANWYYDFIDKTFNLNICYIACLLGNEELQNIVYITQISQSGYDYSPLRHEAKFFKNPSAAIYWFGQAPKLAGGENWAILSLSHFHDEESIRKELLKSND